MHIFVFPTLLLLDPNPFEQILTYFLCKPNIDAGTWLSGLLQKTPFPQHQTSSNSLDTLLVPNKLSGNFWGFF